VKIQHWGSIGQVTWWRTTIGQDLKNIRDNHYAPSVHPLILPTEIQQGSECGITGSQKNPIMIAINKKKDMQKLWKKGEIWGGEL
jgi:hypothetical protein